MWFIAAIIGAFESVSRWFGKAAETVTGWLWPFSLLAEPLNWIYYAFWGLEVYFTALGEWLNGLEDWIIQTLSSLNVELNFGEWIDRIVTAYNWVLYAWDNVWDIADVWWRAKREDIGVWIGAVRTILQVQIDSLTTSVADILVMMGELELNFPDVSELLAWFSNWRGKLLSVINSWWTSTMVEVQSLIDSAFITRASFWAGWQDWRGKVTEFFTDPEDWLYKSFDRIIERFW